MVFDDKSLAPYHGSEPFIFISYSHRNSARAAEFIRQMNRSGFRVWYDEGLIPGREWDENIARIIMDCSYVIALLTPEYLASANCRDELNFARDKNKPLLLIYLDEVTLPAGMELRLGRIFAVHRAQYATDEAFYSKVFSAKGIALCNKQYVPGTSSDTAPSVKASSSARSPSGPARVVRTEQPRSSGAKAYTEAESPSSGSGLQVLGVILLLALFAAAAFLIYRAYVSGSDTVLPPAPPPVQEVTPTPSNEAELDIEATPMPSPSFEVTPPPTPEITPEPTSTPELTPTPAFIPETTLPPIPEETPGQEEVFPDLSDPTPTPDIQIVEPEPSAEVPEDSIIVIESN